MRRIIVVYGLLVTYMASERFLRQGEAARSLEGRPSDKGSTRDIGRAIAAAALTLGLAPLANRYRIAVLPRRHLFFWIGVPAMAGGLFLRSWATRVLGSSYTRTLRVDAGQHLIDRGPYSFVRHPGYLGTFLVWIGAALALGNGAATAITTGVLLRAYRGRVAAEEKMLLDSFGDEYSRYARRTRRIVPFIY